MELSVVLLRDKSSSPFAHWRGVDGGEVGVDLYVRGEACWQWHWQPDKLFFKLSLGRGASSACSLTGRSPAPFDQ